MTAEHETLLHILSVASNYESFPEHRDAIINEIQHAAKYVLNWKCCDKHRPNYPEIGEP